MKLHARRSALGMIGAGLLAFALSATAQECHISFQVDGGYVYGIDRIRDFVVKEVRPELSRVDRPFEVEIGRVCDDGTSGTVRLGMRTGNLYIVRWDDKDLDQDIVRYTDDELDISAAEFQQAVADALVFHQLATERKQRTLKMFAFVFAEAARFSNVEVAVDIVLNSKCKVKWTDYSRLLRSWKLISIFANDKALISGTPYIGGSRAFLIAPISTDMVEKYNTAIAAGWTIEDGEFTAAAKLDPIKYTARSPAPNCTYQ